MASPETEITRQPVIAMNGRDQTSARGSATSLLASSGGPAQIARQPAETVDARSLENLPIGLDGEAYQLVDLDGEGPPDNLTEQADAWFYNRNSSPTNRVSDSQNGARSFARFGPVEVIGRTPSDGIGGTQLLDLAGDGQVNFVRLRAPAAGFYERTHDAAWSPFRPFGFFPNLNTGDTNPRFVHLSGDEQLDMLLTEGKALAWYPLIGEDSFGEGVRRTNALDEERGPRVLFSDATGAVVLGDFSNLRFSGIARIRSGDICYWPNLGYGRFEAKVTMDNAPVFDHPDLFDARRLRLADTDGSGTTDIAYVAADGIRLYQAGNAWSDTIALPQVPVIDGQMTVQVIDVLGSGTACLVWSTSYPEHPGRTVRDLDLMGGQKPHLLTSYSNGMGNRAEAEKAAQTWLAANAARAFSMTREFSSEWAAFKNTVSGQKANLKFNITERHLAYRLKEFKEPAMRLHLTAEGDIDFCRAEKVLATTQAADGRATFDLTPNGFTATGDYELRFNSNAPDDLWIVVEWSTDIGHS
jgi:hypothetical protein